MLDEISLISLPAKAKSFTQRSPPWLLIVTLHMVAIGGRFFFSVFEDNFRDRSSVAFSKGAALGWIEGGRYARLEDVRVS